MNSEVASVVVVVTQRDHLREELEANLVPLGYRVVGRAVSEVEQGLDLGAALVVVDFHLPDDLAPRLVKLLHRQLGAGRERGVLLLADSSNGVVATAAGLGVDELMVRPIDWPALDYRLQVLLRNGGGGAWESYCCRLDGLARRRTLILDAIATAARTLLQGGRLQEDLEEVTALLGRATAAARGYIYQNHVVSQRTGARCLCQWNAVGACPEEGFPQWLDYREHGLERWEGMLARQEVVHGVAAAFPDSEAECLLNLGVISIALFPVMVGEEWWGFLGFDDCGQEHAWSAMELNVMRTAAAVLGAAIRRERIEESLRQAKEDAIEVSKLKDKFVSLVAHDLRSPLSSILGLLEFIQDDPQLPTAHADILSDVMASGRNLLEMIENLLNISRLQTGKIAPRKGFFDGHFLVEEVVQRLKPIVTQKRLVVENLVPEETRVYADQTLLGEVLHNLLSNAVKFSHPGQVIEVFRPEGEPMGIAVRDQGLGISADNLPKLFNIEERVSMPGTAGERGNGFGLPYSFDIMEAHAGTIRVSSEPNQGSTFVAVLPLVKPLILVVEDEELDRLLITSFLESMDVEVMEAANGAAALELLKRHRPHLIISDITMPGMDGFELLAAVKAHHAADDLPVIVVTGDEKAATRDRAFRVGAADFTVKPIVAHDFLPRVRRQIS